MNIRLNRPATLLGLLDPVAVRLASGPPGGESTPWAYPGGHIPISSPRVRQGFGDGFRLAVGVGESRLEPLVESVANSETEKSIRGETSQ